MEYQVKEEGQFKYIETQGGENNLLLLHGLFGALSNFSGILDQFGSRFNVIVPILPIFELPLKKATLGGLLDHVNAFVEFKGYEKLHVLGNSLGGHISLLFAFSNPDKMSSLTLTGSSGLFENAFGSTFPRRGNYEFIKTKTQETFFDPEVATKDLVDEVFDIVNDRNKALRVVTTAKSAIRHNVGDRLDQIKVPTLLIWGAQDTITPPFVGEKFNELISDSTLVMIDRCGHAPMMEHQAEFNQHLDTFLQGLVG